MYCFSFCCFRVVWSDLQQYINLQAGTWAENLAVLTVKEAKPSRTVHIFQQLSFHFRTQRLKKKKKARRILIRCNVLNIHASCFPLPWWDSFYFVQNNTLFNIETAQIGLPLWFQKGPSAFLPFQFILILYRLLYFLEGCKICKCYVKLACFFSFFLFFFAILGYSDWAPLFACDSNTPTNLELDMSQSMKGVDPFMEWRKIWIVRVLAELLKVHSF